MSERPEPLRALLRAPLEPGDEQRLWHGIAARRRTRSLRRSLVPAFALACAASALLLAYRAGRVTAPDEPRVMRAADAAPLRLASGAALPRVAVPEGVAPHTLALSDGTRVALAAGSTLSPRLVTAARTQLVLERGRARFEVQPQRGKRFEVISAGLHVEVVGTVFTVERARAAESALVAVEHGRVRVHAAGLPDGGVLLGAGETLQWPALAAPAHDAAEPAQPVKAQGFRSTAAASARPAPAQAVMLEPWRAAAAAGDLAGAYALLGAPGFARAVRAAESPRALLELSDVARGAQKPAPAASALSRLLERHPRSEQAALAALTLGRLQLDALAQPRAALRSLRRALELGLPDALHEDALARLVHACADAREPAEAARAAQQYRSKFPGGRFRKNVDAWAAASAAAAK